LLPVWAQSNIGDKGNTPFSLTGQEIHHLDSDALQRVKGLLFGTRHEHQVEVRAVVQFRPAQLAKSDDDDGIILYFIFPQNDLEDILQAGIRECGKFREALFEICPNQDVAQTDAQKLGLVIAAHPELLILILQSVPQVSEDFVGGLPTPNTTA